MRSSTTTTTPAMIHTRTRSRWYMESPLRAASPLKHKGAVRHVPKRRRLGMSSLSVNRLPSSSDTDSNETYPLRSRFFQPASPRVTPRVNKRSGAQRRSRPSTLFEVPDEMSPRKRKRSEDGSSSMSGSESWVETEDEFPDFIGEGGSRHLALLLTLSRRPTPSATGTSVGSA